MEPLTLALKGQVYGVQPHSSPVISHLHSGRPGGTWSPATLETCTTPPPYVHTHMHKETHTWAQHRDTRVNRHPHLRAFNNRTSPHLHL
jgi:hypothetical protein